MSANTQPATSPIPPASGDVEAFLNQIATRNQSEPEFLQAVHEVAQDVLPFIADKPIYKEMAILERMAEPDRVISFRVTWQADDGAVHYGRQAKNRLARYGEPLSTPDSWLALPSALTIPISIHPYISFVLILSLSLSLSLSF